MSRGTAYLASASPSARCRRLVGAGATSAGRRSARSRPINWRCSRASSTRCAPITSTRPTTTKMIVGAINGMLASLDPHSNYLDAKALGDFQTTMRGEEFGGLGLEVMQEGGLVRVVSPIDDTPAARAGMLSGDVIIKIDDTPVKGLTPEGGGRQDARPGQDARSSSRCSAAPTKDPREFTIVREIINVLPVRSHVEGGDIGYIRITQFNQQTYDGAAGGDRPSFTAIPAPTSSRATSSICATIPAACSPSRSRSSTRSSITARSFRRAGAPPSSSRTTTRAPAPTSRGGKPLVVLINGGSASASEIVSGALAGSQARDADRHALVRQGLGADRAAARRQRRAEADDGALLHAVGPLHPGQGHRARHQDSRRTFPTT